MTILKTQKYGEWVWTNIEMDKLRKTECLCLNCSDLQLCDISTLLYSTCKITDTAMMITRCPKWREVKK